MIVTQNNQDIHFPAGYGWGRDQIEAIVEKFDAEPGTENGFPCIFAHNAFKRELVHFSLVPLLEDNTYDLQVFEKDLCEYLALCDQWDGNINSHHPLLVVFQAMKTGQTTQFFEQIFYQSLQHLIDVDDVDWPSSIKLDADHHSWTMCYKGTEIFINVSHPNHDNRRSRNLGEGLVFVLNPRQRFDVVAPATKQGHLIAEKIRKNIDIYDHIPRTDLLGSYALDEHQWKQYMLPDDNDSEPLKCPLNFHNVGSNR